MSSASRNSIGAYIREQREQAKISIRQLSRAAGVSNPYLSQVERGLRKPSADILQQIAKGLRISAEALYVQAGILDPRLAQATVADAVRTDPELTERQKQMLIEIYESFRKEVRAAADARAAAETLVVTDDSALRLGPDAIVSRRAAAIAAGGADDATDLAAWEVSPAGEIDTARETGVAAAGAGAGQASGADGGAPARGRAARSAVWAQASAETADTEDEAGEPA